MKEILDAALSLPTLIFTVPLVPVTLYWALSIFGLVSSHWFEGAAEGAAEGAVDGLAAKADALAAKADGLAAKADALADGLAAKIDGVAAKADLLAAKADGLAAHTDAVAAKADALVEPGGFFRRAGFGDVPRTLTWSLMIVFGWTFSLLGSLYVPGFQDLATRGLGIAALLALGTLGLAIACTAVAIQPLRKVILANWGRTHVDLLGELCTVTTTRVDRGFGQAELHDGSAVIQVRNPGTHAFKKGDRVVIYDFDADQNVFQVMPFEEPSFDTDPTSR